MSEHSNIMGGSSANQRINCPGSYQLEQEMPKAPASEFAERGSMLHAAMELLIVNDPADMDAAEPLFEELRGQTMGFKEHEITEDLIDTKLRPALESWFELRDKYGFDDWFIEQRVSLEKVISGAFGTADILAKDMAKRLHVLDWKFGDGVPVPVTGNMGLGFYAGCSLYDEDEDLQEFCDDITGVVLHIVQPRIGFDEVIHTWETDEAWIEALVDQAAAAIDQAMGDNPPIKPGDWCRWCRAKPICPAHKQLASDALSKAPASMTAVELSDALSKADLLKSWIASIYELAQTELEAGSAIPGYKLVNKQPRRKWVNAALAEAALKKKRVKMLDMYKKTLLTPTQFEKKSPDVYSIVKADHVVLHSSGLTVVDDSDKREAVTSSAELLTNALPKQE